MLYVIYMYLFNLRQWHHSSNPCTLNTLSFLTSMQDLLLAFQPCSGSDILNNELHHIVFFYFLVFLFHFKFNGYALYISSLVFQNLCLVTWWDYKNYGIFVFIMAIRFSFNYFFCYFYLNVLIIIYSLIVFSYFSRSINTVFRHMFQIYKKQRTSSSSFLSLDSFSFIFLLSFCSLFIL